jgi:hypothetical protein
MNCTRIISIYLLSLGSIKIAKSHYSHHLLLFWSFALKICFCNKKIYIIIILFISTYILKIYMYYAYCTNFSYNINQTCNIY